MDVRCRIWDGKRKLTCGNSGYQTYSTDPGHDKFHETRDRIFGCDTFVQSKERLSLAPENRELKILILTSFHNLGPSDPENCQPI